MNYTSATFGTTHWSVVLAASQSTDAQASEALEQLCRTYWYPLYAYVRRRGYNPEDAEDLTQEFFVRFLAGNYLASVDRERGHGAWRRRWCPQCGLEAGRHRLDMGRE